MTFFQAIILGLIQGITEFLPISSSGHLIFVPKIFGWADQGLGVDAILNIGTVLAVVVYFRKDLLSIAKSFLARGENQKTAEQKAERRLGYYLLLSTLPAIAVGLLGGDYIESHFRSAKLIAFNLIFFGILLGLAEWYQKRKQQKSAPQTELTAPTTALMSVAQAVSLVPGISRSGITMTAALFSGVEKKSVARFAFLMSVPITALAAADKSIGLLGSGIPQAQILPLLVGFLVSFTSGILSIRFLMKILKEWSFLPFVVYRIIIGILIFVFLV